MQALADNPLVHPDEIAVQTDDYGDVVLRGTVGSLVQRTEAARTTRHVPGVHDVSRYRVGFKSNDRIIAHIDRRDRGVNAELP